MKILKHNVCTQYEKRMRKHAYDTRMRRSLTKDATEKRCNEKNENEPEKKYTKSECIHDLLGLIQVVSSLSISKETFLFSVFFMLWTKRFMYGRLHSCLLYYIMNVKAFMFFNCFFKNKSIERIRSYCDFNTI